MTVAVAVALYNGARFIEAQLDTIRNQTLSPDKVVLCDDGSKDDTVQIVREYINKNNLESKWELYENETNLGYIRNFYKAVSLCDTDLVFLSDQDDVWKCDKIEKMTKVMQQLSKISLLSCKYGIIDAEGRERHSIVEPKANESEEINPVCIKDIMRAYRWPGMLMCIRKDFFKKIFSYIDDIDVAHDFMLACLSADSNGFYEYDYIGAYHRRHDSNTAREEHRVLKLLNLERKLFDISQTQELFNNFLKTELPISEETRSVINDRLLLLNKRKETLQEKSILKLIRMYKSDHGATLRFKSFVCDLWLVIFGKKGEK